MKNLKISEIYKKFFRIEEGCGNIYEHNGTYEYNSYYGSEEGEAEDKKILLSVSNIRGRFYLQSPDLKNGENFLDEIDKLKEKIDFDMNCYITKLENGQEHRDELGPGCFYIYFSFEDLKYYLEQFDLGEEIIEVIKRSEIYEDIKYSYLNQD